MRTPIIFDLLRLLLGPTAITPRGIDRVDFAYANYLFSNWPGECLGLLPTPLGMRLFDRERVVRGLHTLEAMWREHQAGHDAAAASVVHRIGGGTGATPQPRHANGHRLWAATRLGRMLLSTGLTAGVSARAGAPESCVYLNVGQLGMAAPWTGSWLQRRPDIRPVYMLHDAIPIERPDLVTPMGCTAHRRMMQTAARHAAGLIFTTQAATASVLRALQTYGAPAPKMISLHLPVAPSFLTPAEPAPPATEHPYFVVIGAIEQRKNLLLLLNVWYQLRAQLGARTPRLVIAGRPGRGGQPILDRLQASEADGDVIVASGLSSPALRHLVANARAVLMPSWAEGFGLPIIEALAVGTPVLASDLAAHREVGAASQPTSIRPTKPAGCAKSATWPAATRRSPRHAGGLPPTAARRSPSISARSAISCATSAAHRCPPRTR